VNEGDIEVQNGRGERTIHLNGDTGDIILSNADFAEDFDILETSNALPGHVMVLGSDGKLKPCTKAYDKSATGVIWYYNGQAGRLEESYAYCDDG